MRRAAGRTVTLRAVWGVMSGSRPVLPGLLSPCSTRGTARSIPVAAAPHRGRMSPRGILACDEPARAAHPGVPAAPRPGEPAGAGPRGPADLAGPGRLRPQPRADGRRAAVGVLRRTADGER